MCVCGIHAVPSLCIGFCGREQIQDDLVRSWARVKLSNETIGGQTLPERQQVTTAAAGLSALFIGTTHDWPDVFKMSSRLHALRMSAKLFLHVAAIMLWSI